MVARILTLKLNVRGGNGAGGARQANEPRPLTEITMAMECQRGSHLAREDDC